MFVMFVITMLEDRRYKSYFLMLEFMLVMFIKDAVLNLVVVSSMVSAVSLTVVNTVLWLIHMNIFMFVMIIGVVAVRVSKLTTMEGMMGILVKGLFDHEMNRLMVLMEVVLTVGVLLMHLVCVSMFMWEFNLLNLNFMVLISAMEVFVMLFRVIMAVLLTVLIAVRVRIWVIEGVVDRVLVEMYWLNVMLIVKLVVQFVVSFFAMMVRYGIVMLFFVVVGLDLVGDSLVMMRVMNGIQMMLMVIMISIFVIKI